MSNEDKEFKKPLGKWLEEEEQVERVVNTFDPTTKKIKTETKIEKEKIRVMYERVSSDLTFCKSFEHEWYVFDHHKYIIKCHKCPLMKYIRPGDEYIDQEGHVKSRNNDSLIA